MYDIGSTLETICFAKDLPTFTKYSLKESAIILLFVIIFLLIINSLM